MLGTSRAQQLLVVATLLLSACMAPLPVDRDAVALMPERAAKGILEKLLGPDWVRAPYVEKGGTCSPIFTKVPISYPDIKAILYNSTTGNLTIHTLPPQAILIYSCFHNISFSLSKLDAKEVTLALRSLGACTSNRTWNC